MKKLIFLLMSVFSVGLLHAQIELPDSFRWGFSTSADYTWTSQHTAVTGGFNLGSRIQYLFDGVEGLYAESGIDLASKGGITRISSNNESLSAYYLEFPILVGYRMPVTTEVALFGSVGSYLSVGLWGNKAKYNSLQRIVQNQNLFSEYRRMDIGVGGRAGIEINARYQLGIGCNFGLVKMNETGPSIRNRVIAISLSYFF